MMRTGDETIEIRAKSEQSRPTFLLFVTLGDGAGSSASAKSQSASILTAALDSLILGANAGKGGGEGESG